MPTSAQVIVNMGTSLTGASPKPVQKTPSAQVVSGATTVKAVVAKVFSAGQAAATKDLSGFTARLLARLNEQSPH